MPEKKQSDSRLEDLLASIGKKKKAQKKIEVSPERVRQLLEEIIVPPLKAIKEKR